MPADLTFVTEIHRRRHATAEANLRESLLRVQRFLASLDLDVKDADVSGLRSLAASLQADAEEVRRAADVESRTAEVLDVLLALPSL